MMQKIIGYKISSSVLKEASLFPTPEPELWLIVDKDFPTDDGLPHFFFDEIQFLRDTDATRLRAIYLTKKHFPGSRVTEFKPERILHMEKEREEKNEEKKEKPDDKEKEEEGPAEEEKD
jgi:hypothetical protein